jgi:hypothetical protein
MEVLFLPFQVFQLFPVLAIVPALLMTVPLMVNRKAISAGPRKTVLFSSGLWLLYALWEYRVQIWAETETAPIRVDLLFIAPILLMVTTWSCIALWRWRNGASQSKSN